MPTVTALSSHSFQTTATATGDGTALDTSTITDLIVQIDGITTATITFEGSLDGGTTYDPIRLTALDGSGQSTTATADGIWKMSLPANLFQRIRCRISSYTSGTITIKGLHG